MLLRDIKDGEWFRPLGGNTKPHIASDYYGDTVDVPPEYQRRSCVDIDGVAWLVFTCDKVIPLVPVSPLKFRDARAGAIPTKRKEKQC